MFLGKIHWYTRHPCRVDGEGTAFNVDHADWKLCSEMTVLASVATVSTVALRGRGPLFLIPGQDDE